MKRSTLIKAVIAELPEDEQLREGVKRTCENCGNFSMTLIPIGLWWSERRCHYCTNYHKWSHVSGLLDELESGNLQDTM